MTINENFNQSSFTGNNGPENGSAPQPTLRRILYRHPSEKMVAGVCGGIADYTGWDPSLVRTLWVIITFVSGGAGLLAYLILALLLPVGTNHTGQVQPPALQFGENTTKVAAGVIIAIGVMWLLGNVGILPVLVRVFGRFVGILFWPALLIGIGMLLLRANSKKDLKDEVSDAASRMKSAVDSKLPSGDEVRSGFARMQANLPLRRSQSDKVIFGVFGGIAQKTGVDANLLRLIWAAVTVGSMGAGLLLYIGAGLLIPPATAMAVASPAQPSAGDTQDIKIVDGSAERVG